MTPYLLIKIFWVAGALSGLLPGTEHLSVAAFVALNLVTVGMAAAGIALSLALIRPWGERIPAFVVVSCAWIGCGFLLPMVPYAVVDSLIPAADPASGRASSGMPAWEAWLIQFSFLGMAVCLAVALPLYLRARWPAAFAGRIGDGGTARRLIPGYRAAVAGTLMVGVLDLYWAAGGTIGLRYPQARDLAWRLQTGNAAVWSIAGAWSLWVIARARPSMPAWIPFGAGWLVSGFLVAWGCWKLPFAMHQAVSPDPGTLWPERLDVAAAQFLLGAVSGAVMLAALLRACRTRPPADPSAGRRTSGACPGEAGREAEQRHHVPEEEPDRAGMSWPDPAPDHGDSQTDGRSPDRCPLADS
ncbi:hypothetical protein [Actinoplanes sp. NPDC026623]|uniref:hypothetical protein n=1 Tax=Actinoplanes sp. NPDC026623 TaxID=3155610 RepID=UPI0033F49203